MAMSGRSPSKIAPTFVDCFDVYARASDARRLVCESVPSDTLVPNEGPYGRGSDSVERKANGVSHVLSVCPTKAPEQREVVKGPRAAGDDHVWPGVVTVESWRR